MDNSKAVRQIKEIHSVADNKTIIVPTDFGKPWLAEQAKALRSQEAKEIYLLSFHDDGVVWGKLNGKDEMETSDKVIKKENNGNEHSPSPKFRIETLQECRLFSERGELLIWRTSETAFKARQILDDKTDIDKNAEYFDEPQVLWGREIDEEYTSTTFTVVREGQGVCHAFPMGRDKLKFGDDTDETKRPRPLRLCVRHYLEYDKDGCVRIVLSRLVKVYSE